jgi:hypothetical protein
VTRAGGAASEGAQLLATAVAVMPLFGPRPSVPAAAAAYRDLRFRTGRNFFRDVVERLSLATLRCELDRVRPVFLQAARS